MELWVQFEGKCYSRTVAFAASLQHSQQDRLGCPFCTALYIKDILYVVFWLTS